MERDEFLRKVPKVELHCHFEGTVRAATFADLARKHGVTLPAGNVDELYSYNTIVEFLVIFGMVSSTIIDREDFARCAYESLEDGARLGNLKYREMFFNPTLHTRRGVATGTVIGGLVDGIHAAERDLGVRCRLIADVYRQDPPDMARQMVAEVLENRVDELIGLGMDGAEAPDPPEKFAEAFALARRGGLRLTSHASEDAPRSTSSPASTPSAASGSTTATTSSRIRRLSRAAATRESTSPAVRPRQPSSTDGRT